MTNNEFIKLIGNSAVKHYAKYRILPSLTIAQAILESNWGKSMLSQKAYNYFGMKAGSSWKGRTYSSKTQEQTPAGQSFTVNADFRAYKNTDEGIKGYYDFLQYDRYKNLKGVTDYKTACRLIKEDGWATDISYTYKLVCLIEKHNLFDYDKKALEGDEMVEYKALWIDGKEYKDIKQINKDGLIYVAVSDLKQAGYNVGWNADIKTASIGKRAERIKLSVEAKNEKKEKEVYSVLIDGSNYCKVRDLVEALSEELKDAGFNIKVGYNAETKVPSIVIK